MAATYIPIATVTAGSGSSQVDITSIPTTYDTLVLRISARSTHTNAKSSIYFQFNNNTGVNTWGGYITGEDSTISGGSQQGSFQMGLGGTIFVPASSATSNNFSCNEITIQEYKSSSKKKTIGTLSGAPNSAGGSGISFSGGIWNSTAIISTINIFTNSGNFEAGSTFRLYGISNS